MSDRTVILLILLANSLIWLRSSFGKLSSGKFLPSLAGTLEKFASNNPYPWFKSFLQGVAIPNATVFGLLTMVGETLVATGLTAGLLYLLTRGQLPRMARILLITSLLGGMFLNAVFWLASGWTNPSTDSLNLLMFGVQAIGLIYVLKLK